MANSNELNSYCTILNNIDELLAELRRECTEAQLEVARSESRGNKSRTMYYYGIQVTVHDILQRLEQIRHPASFVPTEINTDPTSNYKDPSVFVGRVLVQ